MLSQKKTNCEELANPTWKCHHTNLWNAKLFHLIKGLLHSFKCGLSLLALKRTGFNEWQLECQASNVTASITSDHLIHAYMLPVLRHWSIASSTTVATSRCHNSSVSPTGTQYTYSSCNVGYDGTHSGFRYGSRNADGSRILEFADGLNLVICNTLFTKQKAKLVTYVTGPLKYSWLYSGSAGGQSQGS